MTMGIGMRWWLGAVVIGCLGPVVAGQQAPVLESAFIARQPEELLPAAGATNVIIAGDPSKAGWYVIQNTFAPGRGTRPHFHDQDRYVTVIKGTWWVALGKDGDVYDPAKMTPMKPGSFVLHPAFGHHYDGARDEEVVVRIMGMGPVRSTQLP